MISIALKLGGRLGAIHLQTCSKYLWSKICYFLLLTASKEDLLRVQNGHIQKNTAKRPKEKKPGKTAKSTGAPPKAATPAAAQAVPA